MQLFIIFNLINIDVLLLILYVILLMETKYFDSYLIFSKCGTFQNIGLESFLLKIICVIIQHDRLLYQILEIAFHELFLTFPAKHSS